MLLHCIGQEWVSWLYLTIGQNCSSMRIEAVVSDKAQAARWTSLRPSSSLVLATAIFVVAFTARLLPVIRGGGLTGIIDYDDGVHFAAAIGLVHGQLPYRDFLLLHPPGIVLVLSPFAGLALVVGEPLAFGVARLAFMALGGFNAALIAHYLRPYGSFGAVVGGLLYAVFWPAVFTEHSVLQEGVGNTCLLAALVLLSPLTSGAPSKTRMVVAGCFLGFAAAIKIWAVVPVLIMFGWAFFLLGGRRAAHFLLGAIGACTAACLLFFLSAPRAMWRMVVLDQMQRNPTAAHIAERLRDVLGLVILPADRFSVALIAALAVVAAGCVVGWASELARPAILLLIGFTVLLLVTPSWFFHYSGLTATVLAITAGAAAQRLRDLSAKSWRSARAAVVVAAAMGLVAAAVGPLLARTGERFPRSEFTAAVSGARCVTSDHPSALILTDRVATNIGNGCPLVVDLGGAAHHLRPDRVGVTRARNQAFQAFAVEYLASGDRTIIARFHQTNGFDKNTAKIVKSWHLVARSGSFAVRAPHQ
jgi:alpha-1,2-mannosyltransferase